MFRVVYAPSDSINCSEEWLHPAQRFDTYNEALEWAAENRWCEECRNEWKRQKAGIPSAGSEAYPGDLEPGDYSTPCDCEWWIEDENWNNEE